MANIQDFSYSKASRPQNSLRNPSMKAPDFFDGPQPLKLRSFINSCHLIFHNDQTNFSENRKKVLYATSLITCRAAKWIEPYLSNLTNQDQTYLLNNWALFKSQLFTSFWDPNEVRTAEAELDGLRMKDGAHFYL
ncbi:hypothetical protein O181_033208 [Austropuccinia psidii MF-1]|uniref:DUF4939 domain-containing protein n=1 Tax=Austropuccinia psidii MF-1 TaxID=1389203 RepID=A0A9Q3H685_9BASI|nr:hypothetical protein [Austropuccinia psidii MF-1]